MRILLAGGSGVLGRHTTEALTAAGHEVTGLGRGPAHALRADLLDREAVLRAVDGRAFDAVVHAATALGGKSMTRHQDLAATNALRIDGTAHLLAAARATGARRFVVESMMFGYGYGDHGPGPVTEDGTPFGPKGANTWLERHVGAMRTLEAKAFDAEGVEAVGLRFGIFYGAGVTDTSLVPRLRKRAAPVFAEHGRALSWVDVQDAGRAVLLAVDRGRPGQAYNVADDTPLGWATHVRAVAEAYGTPRPPTVPLWLLRAAPLAHTMMRTNLRLSNAKAREELGWAPTDGSSVDGVRRLASSAAPATS